VAGGDHAEAARDEGEGAADRRGRLVSERERERARRAGWHARGRKSEMGREGGKSRARGEGGRGYGPEIGPARGEGFSFFISYFYFLFLFLLSPFLLNN
jgi:YD repeat-containing protein